MPAPGYYFASWSDDLAGAENPVSLDILYDSLITADFSPIVHTISLEVDGNGSTEPAVGTHEYNEGDAVSITAIPDEGWQFDGWSGDVTDPQLTITTLIVTSDKTVTADFSRVEPDWLQVLRTLYDEVLVMFRQLGNWFTEA